MLKSALFSGILFLIFSHGYSQNSLDYNLIRSYPDLLVNPYSSRLSSDSILVAKTKDNLHPHLFESISMQEKDSIRKVVLQRIKRDTLNLTELLYCFKPYFERLRFEDPHFRPLIPWFITKNNTSASDKVPLLPWEVVNINDTIIIERSYDEKFYKGDRIVDVNNIPIEEFIKYTYADRYSPFFVYQAYYHYAYSPQYVVKIQRQTQVIDIITSGITYVQYLKAKAKEPGRDEKLWPEYNLGYFSIADFDNNKKLIKDLTTFMKRLKEEGYSNLILDLRKNGGGRGDRFDDLMSFFIKRDTILYLKEVKLRASEINIKDYDFLTQDMMGQLVNLPEKDFIKSFPLDRKKYQGLNTYVLISENTGSQAATFANIIQNNNGGKLVGEPLLHNALKYGEIEPANWNKNRFCVFTMSTVMMDEYTKSADGQVYPDISIPFVAAEYMNGGDPVLEKLLEYIKNKNE